MIPLAYRIIATTALKIFTVWLIQVLLMVWLGYPGVVCITPAAWILSIVIGIQCVNRSPSPETIQRLLEAGASGALYGFLTGVLFAVVGFSQNPPGVSPRSSTLWLSTGMVFASIMVSATAAAASGWMTELRKNPG